MTLLGLQEMSVKLTKMERQLRANHIALQELKAAIFERQAEW